MMIMKVLKLNNIIYIALLALVSCSSKSITPSDYVKYMSNEKNGLAKDQSFDNLFFKASFLTKDYLVCKSVFRGGKIETEEVKKHINDIEDLFYINLKIWSSKDKDPFYAGKIDESIYNERIVYSNTKIINDFKLMINGDDYACKFVSFEPTHSISSEVTFALAFDKDPLLKDKDLDIKLIYDDKLFGLGILKFNFNSDDIKNIPTLNL